MKYPCPCCGYVTLTEGPGLYEICPICFWEDDLAQLRFPAMTWGPNKTSLIEAQKNFIKFGAAEKRNIKHVRKPQPDEKQEPLWRTIDPDKDNLEIFIAGKEYGMTYPKDSMALYYWRESYWRK